MPGYIAPIDKHVQHVLKVEMLNIQFINIMCMAKQFQLNNEIRNVLLLTMLALPNKNITRPKLQI
jgi:hypothetical protein